MRSPIEQKAHVAWLIALVVLLFGLGCSDPLSRVLDREDAYVVVDHVDVMRQRSRLKHDYLIAADVLRSRASQMALSTDPMDQRLLPNARQRLAELQNSHRRLLKNWDDFVPHVSPGDRVMYAHKRSKSLRYYLAVRGKEIVARSEMDDLDGAIE